MRKRRRLANKMTIMVCAVLIAVSTFFYVPMEVDASNVSCVCRTNGVISAVFTSDDSGYFDVNYLLTSFSPGYTYSGFYYFASRVKYDLQSSSSVSATLYSQVSDVDVTLPDGTSVGADFYPSVYSLNKPYGSTGIADSYFNSQDIYLRLPKFYIDSNDLSVFIRVRYNFQILDDYSFGLDTDGFPFKELKVTVGEPSLGSYDLTMEVGDTRQDSLKNQTNTIVGALNGQTDELNENADKNTDTMVNGFDNSQGDAVNSDLSSGLGDYQASEDNLFATATTGMKDFTFFDIESVPAMVSGISFITATMTSWFNQAGGASGVGIVLSILFSVMLVAMVLGLYRWYQSRGGKD